MHVKCIFFSIKVQLSFKFFYYDDKMQKSLISMKRNMVLFLYFKISISGYPFRGLIWHSKDNLSYPIFSFELEFVGWYFYIKSTKIDTLNECTKNFDLEILFFFINSPFKGPATGMRYVNAGFSSSEFQLLIMLFNYDG